MYPGLSEMQCRYFGTINDFLFLFEMIKILRLEECKVICKIRRKLIFIYLFIYGLYVSRPVSWFAMDIVIYKRKSLRQFLSMIENDRHQFMHFCTQKTSFCCTLHEQMVYHREIDIGVQQLKAICETNTLKTENLNLLKSNGNVLFNVQSGKTGLS